MHLEKWVMAFGALALYAALSTANAAPVFTTTDIRTTCPTPSTVGAYSSTPVTCQTGNVNASLLFSGFTNSASASGLAIQPLANTDNQGFYFPVNLMGPANFTLGFNVQALNQLATGLNFHVTASSSAQNQSSATISVCPGQVQGCSAAQAQTLTLGSHSLLPADSISFAPTALLGITITGSGDLGTLLSQFETTISTTGGATGGVGGNVPEPGTPFLVAAGLLGFCLMHLHKLPVPAGIKSLRS